jgi:hypothetical protein
VSGVGAGGVWECTDTPRAEVAAVLVYDPAGHSLETHCIVRPARWLSGTADGVSPLGTCEGSG